MAIFSLTHNHIGRSTHQANTASAHIDYITESTELGKRSLFDKGVFVGPTCTEVLAARMPQNGLEAMAWLDDQEKRDRKNARMIDKVRIALPAELTHEQNARLVNDYCERVSLGRIPWLAAIHDNPLKETNEQGQYNPHAHLVFRDRDEFTNKRVLCISDNLKKFREEGKPVPEIYADCKTTTDRFRIIWEETCNQHLMENGFDARIDRRTLKEQGIDRQPQIHVGVAAAQMYERGIHPETNPDYIFTDGIDQGLTRLQANQQIIHNNLIREAEQFGRLRANEIVEQEAPRPTGPVHIEGVWPQQWEDRQGYTAQTTEAMKWVRDAQAPGQDPNHQWTDIRPSRPELSAEEPRAEQQTKTEQTQATVEKQAKRERQEGAVDKAWLNAIIQHRSEKDMDDDSGLEM